jgi:hypothetical protein
MGAQTPFLGSFTLRHSRGPTLPPDATCSNHPSPSRLYSELAGDGKGGAGVAAPMQIEPGRSSLETGMEGPS